MLVRHSALRYAARQIALDPQSTDRSTFIRTTKVTIKLHFPSNLSVTKNSFHLAELKYAAHFTSWYPPTLCLPSISYTRMSSAENDASLKGNTAVVPAWLFARTSPQNPDAIVTIAYGIFSKDCFPPTK